MCQAYDLITEGDATISYNVAEEHHAPQSLIDVIADNGRDVEAFGSRCSQLLNKSAPAPSASLLQGRLPSISECRKTCDFRSSPPLFHEQARLLEKHLGSLTTVPGRLYGRICIQIAGQVSKMKSVCGPMRT